MSKINFLPWVGQNYSSGINGKKVLVLGESHYCENSSDAVSSITIDIINDLCNADSEHEPYKNTYTKFIRALVGRDISSAYEKLEAWNKVVFYNYVQFAISDARIAPSADQFKQSEDAFFEVLETYRPDIVIAWGKRLYNALPTTYGCAGESVRNGGDEIETWVYNLPSGISVRVLHIVHPSAGFTPSVWHSVICGVV